MFLRKPVFSILFALALGHARAWAEPSTPLPTPEPGASEGTTVTAPKKNKAMRIVPVPFAAYKDTYGFIAGGGLVLYVPQTQTRLSASAITNFKNYSKYRTRIEWIKPQKWIFDANGYLGYDLLSYYGEGDDTPSKAVTQKSTLNGAKITLMRQVDEKLFIGPSFEYRFRRWDDPGLLDPAVFRNESEWRFGIQTRWEGRDSLVEPRRGYYGELDAYALPNALQNGFGSDVVQVETDLRAYRPLWPGGVLVTRLNAGNSFGDPSYSYRYSLGGTSLLRGYLTNRFRGKRFYVAQAEARSHVWKWFGVDTGFDLGDVTDGRFTSFPKLTYQAGLSSTLLERYGMELRLESGWAKGSHNFFFNAFEPF